MELFERQETAFHNHIIQVSSAIGGWENVFVANADGDYEEQKVFVIGDQCLECLRDIKRYLRRDDNTEDRLAFKILGKIGLVQNTLLPLLSTISSKLSPTDLDRRIHLAIIEILVPLTWPLSPTMPNYTQELDYQQQYKQDFLDHSTTRILLQDLLTLFSKHHLDLTDKETAKIRLIFLFFRNVLAIKDPISGGINNSSTEKYQKSLLQERIVVEFEREYVLEFLVSFAVNSDGNVFFERFKGVVLECVYLVFRERSVEVIAGFGGEKKEKKVGVESGGEKIKFGKGSTRHSRFGGTISYVFSGGQKYNVHKPSALFEDQEEVLNGMKSIRNKPMKKVQDESEKISVDNQRPIIDDTAQIVFKSFAEQFLENSFNAIVEAVKKDIDRESENIRDDDVKRLIWICRFFMEFQIHLYKDKNADYEYDIVSSIMNSRGISFVVKHIRLFFDEKRWDDVGIAVNCFGKMLTILKNMNQSNNVAYKESSQNMQSNLFYEIATIEMFASLLRNHKELSRRYLQTLIETVHIFLDMLRSYSKSHSNMVVSKLRKSRKKDDAENDVQEDSEARYERVERELKFEKIEALFGSETIITTYLELLKHYETLDHKYISYITVMFHRIFVKLKLEAYFYKLSTMVLFNRIQNYYTKMVKPSKSMDGLIQFINYVLSKMFRKMSEYPILYIEMLYPKSKSDVFRISENKLEDTPRLEKVNYGSDVEVEIKRGLTWPRKIAVAVRLLVEKDKHEFLDSLVKAIESLQPQFSETEPESESEQVKNNDLELKLSEELSRSTTRDTHVALLFETLQLVNVERKWYMPSSTTKEELETTLRIIREAIATPLEKEAVSMLRKKAVPKPPRKKEIDSGEQVSSSSKSSASSSSSEVEVEPERSAERRVRREKRKAEKEEKRRKRRAEKEEKQKKKSTKKAKEKKPELSKAFITDSEDELDDPEFFRMEREKRMKREENYALKIREFEESVVESERKKKAAMEMKRKIRKSLEKRFGGSSRNKNKTNDSDDDVDENDGDEEDVDSSNDLSDAEERNVGREEPKPQPRKPLVTSEVTEKSADPGDEGMSEDGSSAYEGDEIDRRIKSIMKRLEDDEESGQEDAKENGDMDTVEGGLNASVSEAPKFVYGKKRKVVLEM